MSRSWLWRGTFLAPLRSRCYNPPVYIERLSLTNFRNYRELTLRLPPGQIVVYGGNAQGKTNLLEAIYFLATGHTPHATSDRQLIHWAVWEDPLPFARLEGDFVTDGERRRIEIALVIHPTRMGQSSRIQKTIRVNGVPRRVSDLLGLVNVVLFSPTDTALVVGSPGERRHYLDEMLCQLDGRYARTLARYRKILTQRNHLLRRLRDEGGHPNELQFWDDQLVSSGAILVYRRLQVIERLKSYVRRIHNALTGDGEALEIAYVSSVLKGPAAEAVIAPSAHGDSEPPPLLPKHIEGVFRARLQERAPAERAQGITLVGPHRADLSLTVNGIDMRVYSSRGQQRTIALALRLAEAALFQDATGTPPLLLLDDVLGELDAVRRRFLMDVVRRHQQAFLTSTDLEDFTPEFLAKATVLHVESGTITAVR